MIAVALGGFDITSGGLALGLFTGSTYALLAAGLVLVYRSSGVINFAHGQIGARRLLVGEQLAPAQLLLSGSYLYTTPTLLTAYMISLMLFIIFISGFCCLFSLQTPKSFDELKSA